MELSLFEKSEEISESSKGFYQLTYWPIMEGTDRLWIDGELKSRGLDYTIDYNTGQVSIKAEVAPESGAFARIDYQIIPISVQRSYQRQIFATPEREEPLNGLAARSTEKPAVGTLQPSADLNLSGAKTISLSMESARGLGAIAINQPTRLSVSGKVSENVSVMAMLSDQDLPLQPEGTTEEIEDLDRILIKIQGKHLSATMGDYEAAFGETEFVLLKRMLAGAQAQGEFDFGGFTLLGAVSRGQTRSVTFPGMEGQNEYRINVDGRYIVMVAGSETVWLNGEKMRRGEENDYVIRDYGDPIIEFTNRHLITKDDVIAVDFEYIEEDRGYKQDLYGTRGKVNLWGLSLGVSYAAESDDKDNPLISLNDDEIASLRLNDLDPDGDGVLLPAPAKRRVTGFDSRLSLNDNLHLSGEVAFSKRDPNTFSLYDRLEEGRAWKLVGVSGTDRFRASFDFRQLDPNFVPIGGTFSSRTRSTYQKEYENVSFGEIPTGLQQNAPAPGEVSYNMDLWSEPVEHLDLSGNLGRTSDKYSKGSAASKRVTDHWSRSLKISLPNLPQISTRYQEATTAVDGAIAGDLHKTRELWEVDHRIGEKINIAARSEETELIKADMMELSLENSSSDSSIVQGSLEPLNSGALKPSGDEDRRREDRRLTFEIPYLSGEYSFETDYTRRAPGEWSKSSSARTISTNLSARPKSWLDFSGYFARRKFSGPRVRGGYAGGMDDATNLADLKLNLKMLRVNYQIDRKLASEREEQYVNYILTKADGREEKRFLRPGEGSYVKIDEYTYREDMEKGDYIRLVRTVRDRPVASLTLQSVFDFRPRGSLRMKDEGSKEHRAKRKNSCSPLYALRSSFIPHPSWISMLEVGVRVSEEQEKASKGFYLLQDLQTDKTIYGLRKYWYRAQISPIKRLMFITNWEMGRTLNRRLNKTKREFRSDRWNIKLESPIAAKLSLGGSWEQDNSSESVSKGSPEEIVSDISERQRSRSISLRYLPTRVLSRLELEGTYETEWDEDERSEEPPVFTSTISISPEAAWSFSSRGTVAVKYEIARGISSGKLPFARYDFHEGISHRIRLETNYRLKWFTDLTAKAIYRAEIAEDEKPDHLLEMEVTANF